jgi:phosphomannomutase
VVGEFLTPAIAAAFAQAFGTYVGGGRVVVGRDTRASGEMLEHAVACGLLAAGCEVARVGVLPTPTIQMYVAASRARGGMAITASHNPPEYNALKLFNARGLFFNAYERGELVDLYHQRAFDEVTNAETRGIRDDCDAPPRLHMDRVLGHVDVARVRRARFRVALDAVNGAGSVMSCTFLRDRLGCELRAMSVDPTLPFPRIAEPRPDTIGELARLVAATGAAVGFALDPDADRLAIVDENGDVIDNDDVLALVADTVFAKRPGDAVVNLTTSSSIEEIAARHGRRVYRTAVGEANVVETMQAVHAVIGGEGSNGGIIFPAVHLCRDSFTGMALVLDRMAGSGQSVSRLVASLPRFERRQGRATFEHGRLGGLMQELETAFPDARTDRTDGLKLCLPDGWIHVRASNTEPLLRVAVEARGTEAADALFATAMGLLAQK